MSVWQSGDVESNGIRMHYTRTGGDKPPIVLALEAWEVAKATFQQLAIPYAGMIVHHDQDSVYTGYHWTGRLLLEDGVRLSYTLSGLTYPLR